MGVYSGDDGRGGRHEAQAEARGENLGQAVKPDNATDLGLVFFERKV